MSPRVFQPSSSPAVADGLRRFWTGMGVAIRDARLSKRWSVPRVAEKAGISRSVLYVVEAGQPTSIEALVRVTVALGLRLDCQLIDPRRRTDPRPELSGDPVHSAMGELEARHLRSLGLPIGIDEPYQHYQFAGRADLVAWDVPKRALLHIENRTRFPDFQDMAGSFNAKKAYLASAIGARVGVDRWASQTHVIAAVWTSEVLHTLRLRRESFRSLCPDTTDAIAGWWQAQPPPTGIHVSLVVLDPLAHGRQRQWIGLDDAIVARPRYAGYAEIAANLLHGAAHRDAA